MTVRPVTAKRLRVIALALAATLAAVPLAAALGPAPSAHAAARVTVAGVGGGARANADGATTVGLTGSGFQSVPKGFGGIYVFFGWISDPGGGSWRPSQGGVSGSGYRYVPDAQEAENAGYQKFVAFPGSSTEAEANGGTLAADGSWSTSLVIPGARFTAADGSDVDCTRVQCGVITIGAHGVRNANNETFTPVSFGGSASGSEDGDTDDAEGAVAPNGGTAADDPAEGDPAGESGESGAQVDRGGDAVVTLGVDQATAVVGRVLSFGAQGLEPGEQVTVSLDDGVVAVGPLAAGNAGEVAGLMELPAGLRTGTHVLRLVAPSSDTEIETEVTITRDPAEATAGEDAAEAAGAEEGSWTPAEIAVGVAALLLLVVVVASAASSIAQRVARRRAARSRDSVPGDGPGEPDADPEPGTSPTADGARPADAVSSGHAEPTPEREAGA
ncbi:hypothetical protein GCM10027059_13680 [Myceligenerans halotolerans]